MPLSGRQQHRETTLATRIFISVAEDSADVHAAALVRSAAKLLPGVEFYGLTGPRLQAAGVDTIYDLTRHAAMLAAVVSVIGHAWKAKRTVERDWDRQPPDLVLLLDSPELNLPLARAAHRRGLPVLYYIAPQTWASRAGRNQRIARDIDRLACILPFEESYFRRNLVHADYVGHPLFETLARETANDDVAQSLRNGGEPLVALLPGSRRHVIDAMLPRQLEVVRRMRAAGHKVRAAVSCVSQARRTQIRRHVHAGGFATEIVVADNATLLTAADLVLVASGTATLHVAHYRKPMIVMYDAGGALRLPYSLFGRFIVKLPHLSLLNILAGARIVPEFMPFISDVAPIARVAAQLLTDETWRKVMVRQIDEVVAPLEHSTASANVCRMISSMLAGAS